MIELSDRSFSRIGIVIVNYNTSDQILICLNSIRDIDNYSIVVIDNFSPNDDLSELQAKFSTITIIKLTDNVGFGAGCNIGAEYIFKNKEFQFVLFLNPDTIVSADAIHLLVSAFESEYTGAVVPKIVTTSEPPLIWYAGGDINWWKGSGSIPLYGKNANDKYDSITHEVTFATGCALMLSRSAFNSTQGFDEKYFMYEEDAELSLRLLGNGFRIKYVPDALVFHVGQGSQEVSARSIGMYHPKNPKLPFFVFYVCRNRLYTIKRHGNFIKTSMFIIGFSFWLIKRMIVWVINGRFDAVRAAFSGMLAAGR